MKPPPFFSPRRLRELLVAAVTCQCAAALAVEPRPGEIVDFPVGEMDGTAILYTPKSWSKGSGRKWPVFLYYHGTSGRPTLDVAKRYAGEDAFFLVGMAYSIRGTPQAADNERYHDTETKNLIAARDALTEHGADPRRVYVGGFSKGGWLASHFADRQPKLIAGSVVLGAGRNPWRLEDLPKYPTKLPVYIGVGTAELNYQLGHAGIDHWGKRGAEVTFDPYLGVGHLPPIPFRSEYLHQWFTLETYRDRKTLLRPIFTRWHDATRSAAIAEAKTAPVRAYLLLEHMSKAPLATFLSASQRKALGADIARLKESVEVKAELSQRSAYRRILGKEVLGGFRLRVWIDVIDDYVRIYEAAPGTPTGKRAIADAGRLLQSIRTGVRKEKQDMVESFLRTHQTLIGKIDIADIQTLNSELRQLGEFLNQDRTSEP